MVRRLLPALYALSLTAFLLSSCDSGGPQPTQPLSTDMRLMIHFSSPGEIAAVAKKYGEPEAERTGFAVMHGNGTDWSCELYVAQPIKLLSETQELFGHELLHCLYGRYHP